jgi:hypothetical protein
MSKNSRATSWLVYCAELEAQKRTIISDCFWPISVIALYPVNDRYGLVTERFGLNVDRRGPTHCCRSSFPEAAIQRSS